MSAPTRLTGAHQRSGPPITVAEFAATPTGRGYQARSQPRSVQRIRDLLRRSLRSLRMARIRRKMKPMSETYCQ